MRGVYCGGSCRLGSFGDFLYPSSIFSHCVILFAHLEFDCTGAGSGTADFDAAIIQPLCLILMHPVNEELSVFEPALLVLVCCLSFSSA